MRDMIFFCSIFGSANRRDALDCVTWNSSSCEGDRVFCLIFSRFFFLMWFFMTFFVVILVERVIFQR